MILKKLKLNVGLFVGKKVKDSLKTCSGPERYGLYVAHGMHETSNPECNFAKQRDQGRAHEILPARSHRRFV